MHRRQLPLAYSCPQSLEGMPRVSAAQRWCTVCEKRVHELSAMRESEARALLRGSKHERICIDFQFDEDGRVLFRDPSPPSRSRTLLALAGLALAVVLANGCAENEHELVVQQPDEPVYEPWARGAVVPFTVPVSAVPTPEFGRLLVVVLNESAEGRGIVDAAIEVSSYVGEHIGWTNGFGTRQFHDLEPGIYEVQVEAGRAEAEQWVRVRAGAHSTVTFRIDPTRAPEPERPVRRLRGDVIVLGDSDLPLGDL